MTTWPLTAAQQEIWLGHELDSTGVRYLVGGYVHIHGRIDPHAFERAVRAVVAGSETLRVRISGAAQIVEQPPDSPLIHGTFDSVEAAEEQLFAELDRPFDLGTAPLIEQRLLDVGEAGYLWAVKAHHIVLDGAAFMALLRHVAAAYSTVAAGGTGELGVFDRVQSLVEEDSRYRASRRFQDDREFWSERLRDMPDASMFAESPAGTGPDVPSRYAADLADADWSALCDRGESWGVGWSALVLTAVAGLLHADTGARTVGLGLAVPAKRSRNALGMTANVVPLRLEVAPGDRVAELARQVRAQSLIALRHQRYRLADMHADVAAAGGERRLVGPVVNILPTQRAVQFGPYPATLHHMSPGRTDGVTLSVYEGLPRPRIAFDSNTARFRDRDLAAQHARLCSALRAVAQAPDDRTLGSLRLDAATGGTAGVAVLPRHPESASPAGPAVPPVETGAAQTLVSGFARSAQEHTGAPALTYGAETVTYGALDARSELLAQKITAAGAGPGTRVALLLPRSVEWVVAVVAVLKAGAAAVPIDPADPAARIRKILDDCTPVLVLATADTVLPSSPAPLLTVDGEPDTESPAVTLRTPRPADPAYVMYTSGPAGEQQGVVISHTGMAGLCTGTAQWFGFGPGDVWSLFHSVASDFSAWEIWGALLHGARLVIVPSDTARSPADFRNLLATERVTVLTQSPSDFGLLADADGDHRGAGLAVRWVILTGQTISRNRPASWYARYPNCPVVTMFGATETTVFSTGYLPDPDTAAHLIGRPLPELRVHLLDAALRPVPPGIPGEIYLAGPGVAGGYLNRRSRTAVRFVAEPGGPAGSVMYRTGDAARWSGAVLEYLGRTDRRVQVGGFRIELAAVQAALCALPQVSAAAVVLDDEKRPVAYVVADPDPDVIRDQLATVLPEYELPSTIIGLAELPSTVHGRLDERRLPALRPDDRPAVRDSAIRERETTVHRVFAEVLGRTDFGLDDRFFAIGGDSILAIRVVHQAHAAGLSISAKDIFEHQSVRAIAASAVPVSETAAPEDRAVAYGPLPATPTLELLGRRGVVTDGSARYIVVPLPADLTGPQLLDALQTLLDHHDALRMQAEWTPSDEWRLVIPEPGALRAEAVLRQVRSHGGAAQREIEKLAAQRRLAPHRGVMVQAVRIDEPDGADLLLMIHRLAADDLSWHIVLSDLTRALTGAPLEPVAISLRTWSNTVAEHETEAAEAQWWHRATESAPTTAGRRPLNPMLDRMAGTQTVTGHLDPAQTSALLTAATDRFRADITEVLLTALAVAWAQWRGAGQLLIDITGNGRAVTPELDLSRTVGPFTIQHPVALDAVAPASEDALPGATPVQAIRQVKRRLRAVPHGGIGYGFLHRTGEIGARAPISFEYRDTPDPAAAGESGDRIADAESACAHELELLVRVDEGSLQSRWTWPSALFDHPAVAELDRLWTAALTAFATQHTSPGTGAYTPSDFPLVDLDDDALERFAWEHGTFRDLLPATPTQAGMLFHSLYETEFDPYAVQILLTLHGALDPGRLRTAATAVLHRHPQLAGAFAVHGVDRPVLVVPGDISIPMQVIASDGTEQTVRRLAETDLRALDPQAAPAFRISLVHTAPEQWRLVFSFHHALLDGWSTAVFLRELFWAYHDVPLDPAPSYRDALVRLSHLDRAAAQRAWSELLRGAEPTRIARAAAAMPAEPAELHIHVLDPAVSAALAATAAAHGLTLNSLIQAVWALVLAHLTGSAEVVFGVTVSGRHTGIGTEHLVGMFMNTVPVRARIAPGESTLELAAHIQSQRTALLDHDHLGLVDILGAADSGELFDTALIFENYPLDTATFTDPAAEFSVVAADHRDRTHFPLALTVYPEPELSFRLSIRPQLLDWFGTPADVWAVLSDACAAVAAQPDGPAGRFRLPVAAVLEQGRGPRRDDPDSSVTDAFEAVAATHADRVALWYDGAEITYSELHRRADRFAAELSRRGIRAGVPVGIALPRCPELVIAFLAVLKLGAVCLPIHDGYPPERVDWLLRHTGAELVLRDPAEIVTDAVETVEADSSVTVPPEATAWLMFTSGSTGTPKGVRITHRNIVTRALDQAGPHGVHTRLLLHSPYTWDMIVYELWMPLLTGGSVAIAPPGPVDAATYRRVLADGEVTALLISAGLFQVLAETIPDDLARAGHLATIGDVLAPAAVARVRAANPDIAVTNLYGPVEATAFALAHPIPPGPLENGPVPIGMPVDNTGITVLDPALRPVPTGVSGEIYLSGPGLAAGYLAAPGLSAARFVANPYGPAGSLMYRTGDIGNWDRRGRVHFLGRSDRQQKINGFRVEPGEVEAAIRRQPDVSAAVVTIRQTRSGKSLVAHVVGREARIDPAQLRARLVQALPSYLVPALIVPIDELPLTTNGKIDTTALPIPRHTPSGTAGSQRQQVLATVIAGVLGLAEIGVDDDFFALGGDSLSAIRVVSALNTAFDSGLSVRDVFEAPTVVALEQRLDAAQPVRRRTAPVLGPRPSGPIPLTPAQQRLWTINYLADGQPDYLMTQTVEITGPVNVPALRAAITDVVARHEILRTVLPYAEEGPVQRILPPSAGNASALRVNDCAADDLDSALQAELTHGFDVRTDPPLRTALLRITETRHVFLLVLHHIAGDIESLVRLSHELMFAYTARAAGHAPQWPTPAVQFADYALWLRTWMGAESDPAAQAAAQSRYWLSELAGIPEFPVLPTDHPRTRRVDSRAGTVPLFFDAPTHRAIVRTAQECSASTYLILHTALACVLAGFGAGDDIPIGVAVSGRDHEALDSMIGCAIHTVVVRADTSGARTFRELVAQQRDRLLGATEHKEFPFDRLVALVNPPRSRHHYPLFQVVSTFFRDSGAEHRFGDATARLLRLPAQRTDFDLALELYDRYTPDRLPDGIRGELTYAAELFDHSTIEGMAARLSEVITTLCADIDAPIAPMVQQP